MGKLADCTTIDFQDVVGSRDQSPLVLAASWSARSANSFGVEKSMTSSIRMSLRIGRHFCAGIAQANPLYRHVLRANVQRIVLRAVRCGKDVADIVVAIDFVETSKRSRAPHVDDGVASAREQVRAVRRERERHDTSLVRLDLLHLVEG